jgi:hypothetical protein
MSQIKASVRENSILSKVDHTAIIVNHKEHILDIVDIKPVNMEELTEVITAAEFHPLHCNLFMYSSSKGTIKLGDMRESALCDQHSKGKKQDVVKM